MDDEEYNFIALQEPLYRVETGNYEYRLILRCRQLAREKFAKHRQDVLVKMELLDQKHVQDIVKQLHNFVVGMSKYHTECYETMKPLIELFPIEVDLTPEMLSNLSAPQYIYEDDDDDEEDNDQSRSGDDVSNYSHSAGYQSLRDDKLIDLN